MKGTKWEKGTISEVDFIVMQGRDVRELIEEAGNERHKKS